MFGLVCACRVESSVCLGASVKVWRFPRLHNKWLFKSSLTCQRLINWPIDKQPICWRQSNYLADWKGRVSVNRSLIIRGLSHCCYCCWPVSLSYSFSFTKGATYKTQLRKIIAGRIKGLGKKEEEEEEERTTWGTKTKRNQSRAWPWGGCKRSNLCCRCCSESESTTLVRKQKRSRNS